VPRPGSPAPTDSRKSARTLCTQHRGSLFTCVRASPQPPASRTATPISALPRPSAHLRGPGVNWLAVCKSTAPRGASPRGRGDFRTPTTPLSREWHKFCEARFLLGGLTDGPKTGDSARLSDGLPGRAERPALPRARSERLAPGTLRSDARESSESSERPDRGRDTRDPVHGSNDASHCSPPVLGARGTGGCGDRRPRPVDPKRSQRLARTAGRSGAQETVRVQRSNAPASPGRSYPLRAVWA